VPASLGGTGEASRPYYYRLVRFVGTALPFSLYIPALVIALIPLRRAVAPQLYQLALLIAVLGLFSIASAKRDDYILPAFPPFAIVLASMLTAVPGKIPPLAERLRGAAGLVAAVGMLAMASGQAALVRDLSSHMQSSDAAYLGLFAGAGNRRQDVLMVTVAAAAGFALIRWRRGRPQQVAAALAVAGMAAVSLWIGIMRPELAARRTFKNFAIRMRAATAGQPVYTPGGPDYEISYYYGAPIRALALSPDADAAPRYVLIWDNWAKAMQHLQGREILQSRPALDGHRMVLLKVEPSPFEPSLGKH
jgi:hypothetical protein